MLHLVVKRSQGTHVWSGSPFLDVRRMWTESVGIVQNSRAFQAVLVLSVKSYMPLWGILSLCKLPYMRDSMYGTGGRVRFALGLVMIQAFIGGQQRRKLHELLTSCCLFSPLCWLMRTGCVLGAKNWGCLLFILACSFEGWGIETLFFCLVWSDLEWPLASKETPSAGQR